MAWPRRSTASSRSLGSERTIEAVRSLSQRDEKFIPSEWHEREIIDALGRYLQTRELNVIRLRAYLFLGLTGVREYRFIVSLGLFDRPVR
jgi:hypothetical protein